jgi:hypothetical protein
VEEYRRPFLGGKKEVRGQLQGSIIRMSVKSLAMSQEERQSLGILLFLKVDDIGEWEVMMGYNRLRYYK